MSAAEQIARPARMLLGAEAAHRGFRNKLSFRRWCKRHGVDIIKDGRMEWVRTADIDSALAKLEQRAPMQPAANDSREIPVHAAVAALMRRR